MGGSLGGSDWPDRLSWWAWLVGCPISMCGASVISPGGVRIVHMTVLTGRPGSSSLDAVSVTGSLLFYAPVCCLVFEAVVWWYCLHLACWTGIIFPASGCIFGYAAVGGRAGITFDVELVIPWNAPEAVVDLHSDILMDLEIVPDVIGLTGWRPEAAMCRILQGRDAQSMHVLVPDARGLERNFHDVTIVDMVSLDDLSMLRRQWPATVLRHMA